MPETLAPAAPAAPAALPSAPAPAAAPSAPPAHPTEPTVLVPPGSPEQPPNPYAEIEESIKKLDAKPATTQGKQTPPKPGTPAKPEGGKPPVVPKSVREQWEAETNRLKGELKNLQEAKSSLEAKITDAEKRGKDTEALVERLGNLEKEKESLHAEIRSLKQEKSPEFIKKYDEPFNRAAERARKVVEKIQVLDPGTGNARYATWGEFSKIYQLDPYTALQQFKQTFGEDGAQIAMGYFNDLHRLDDERDTALQQEREQAKTKQAEEQAKQIQSREQINAFWKKTNEELAEKFDDYHDSPDDQELVDARKKALAIFDAPAKTLKEKIIKDAHNRQKVGASVVLKIRLARMQKERDDLKAELDGLKEKPPGAPRRPGGTSTVTTEEDFETGLRKHMAGVH